MTKSFSTLDIIAFGIKKRMVMEFLGLKWQKLRNSWKKNRIQEYDKKAIPLERAFSTLFPGYNIDLKLVSVLENHLDNFLKIKSSKKYPSVENPYSTGFFLEKEFRRFLFFFCHYFKPEMVIETGVAYGMSSSYILQALNLTNKGKLISIDNILRPWQTREKIGSAIPIQIKSRHTLIIGNSIIELRKLVKSLSSLDIFLHDSRHTYDYMMEEFQISWPLIKRGGFLLSDDVQGNDAFLDFCEKVKREPVIIKSEKTFFGIVQK